MSVLVHQRNFPTDMKVSYLVCLVLTRNASGYTRHLRRPDHGSRLPYGHSRTLGKTCEAINGATC